jgi:hypothetical protein
VEFLFTLTGTLSAASSIQGGPAGTRRIVNVTGGSIDGPRLRGTILPPGGDWITVRADGTAKLDVRLTIDTDDGALILMTYTGISATRNGDRTIHTAPLFETGDERYAWLNAVQGIGIGSSGGGVVTYQVYALR